MPEQHATRRLRVIRTRQLRRLRIRQDVVSVHSVITPVENVSLPFADEHALGGAALISRVVIYRPRALRRPAHAFNSTVHGIVDQRAVALQRGGRGVDHGHDHVVESGGQAGVEIIDSHKFQCPGGGLPWERLPLRHGIIKS